MIEDFISYNDLLKIIGVIIVCVVMYFINGFNKNLARKLANKIQIGNTKFKIGIIGDIIGYENNAKVVIEKALNTFVRIGGNVLQTNVIVKTPSKRGILDVVRPIAEQFNIHMVGIHFIPEVIDTRKKREILDDEIDVPNWKKNGDESSTFLKNVDQLILLVGKTNDEVSMKEFDTFKGAKVRYDLCSPNFTQPTRCENIN
ncbi:hypothetical protein EDI_011710 [Entamoeba dispar SAW760]|uniref:Uncharacterized protein n=1 Tax=Entamoeba dispar (strain ATCC PRA-260 / SAW760) TaxID=370354 RepID=B0EBX9_ENTDS|nr:uncharacterized protein EDI_011710 [Entamoeba dispar SAW760]EDR27964.1 hypothetical protein EDI_011710 [Entamoeba dispar SAW760]|eukprot:EDR27964.1 hypothetical protein EDI_011710 [Entamoeba dispar SAW760]